jgi:hypothetical protein
MPKIAIDYSKCCIYKIEHIEYDNLVYVGNTTCFDKRKTAHKSNCNNENEPKYNFKLYQMIRDNGGWDMFKMVEVEKCPCYDKREAERRENELIKELRANMNSYRSFTTGEEKKINNIEYKTNNRVKLLEKQKEYNEKNKDIIKVRKTEYREKNIKNIKKTEKQYRENNKDIIQEKKSEKMLCECGCRITKRSLIRHQATKKHIDLMNKNSI